MADSNEPQDRDNRDNNEEYQDDPVLNERIRRDLRAALTPPGAEFTSRRAQIMAQLRAEAVPPPGQERGANGTSAGAGGAAPLAFDGPRREERRRPRPFAPAWLSSLAAGLIVLVVAGVLFGIILNNQNNGKTEVARNSSGEVSVPAASSATTAAMVATTSAAGATTAAAAAAAQAPAANPNATASSSSGGTTGDRNTTTSAAATTAAATTTSAAAATTSAAATTVAATTAAGATFAATTAAASASLPISGTPGVTNKASPFRLYPNAANLSLPATDVRDFLRRQAETYLRSPSDRLLPGLDEPTLTNYGYAGSRASGARLEDVIKFYREEAARLGYREEAAVPLQTDQQLRVQWLYFSRGSQRVGLLVVEVLDSTAATRLNLNKGDTGIFVAT